MRAWDTLLTEVDRRTVERGQWARRVGPGAKPAVIVIDMQNYMVGRRGQDDSAYPYSCGEVGWRAADVSVEIIAAARAAGAPIIYTRFVLDPSGLDGGVFTRKVGSGKGENAFLRGTHGAEILSEIAPQAGDLVLDKIKASAFFGTPLAALLQERGVDTLIVVGGSTSNCVRATVVDGAQHNFRVLVPEEGVFDRIDLSHAAALFDMDRTFADVVGTDEVIDYLMRLNAQASRQGVAGRLHENVLPG